MAVLSSFRSLYFATMLMLLGSGLLSTYLALQVAERANSLWVGAMMTCFYLGLVTGGKQGHKLIARVGHIRAYVASAGIVTAATLLHGLLDNLWLWLLLRVVVGLGMMNLYMVVESWLNEQSSSDDRGKVFSGYMMASYMGMVIGQLTLASLSALSLSLLLIVALCFALCLVPVALTRRIHPEPLTPANLSPGYFVRTVPISMFTSLMSGTIVGAFYGLAPLYASRIDMPTQQVGLFMASCVAAGLLIQAPLGYLSDRINRSKMIRWTSFLLFACTMPLALDTGWPIVVVFLLGSLSSALMFCLYPLAVAFANDNIPAEKRVSLAAVLLTTFGLGASIGPILVGSLMRGFGPNMLYAVFSLVALTIVLKIRPQVLTGDTMVEEAPLPHTAMPDGLSSSPLAVALDPRVEEEYVLDQMQECTMGHVAETTEEQHF